MTDSTAEEAIPEANVMEVVASLTHTRFLDNFSLPNIVLVIGAAHVENHFSV